MSYETLLVEQRGAVTLITINRPAVLNALSSMVQNDLIAAFAAFEADDSQGCAVLTGAGEKAFVAGADIAEMAADGCDRLLSARPISMAGRSDIASKVRKPWIAAVNGFALGGGCELAMMADMIIASEKAKLWPARDQAWRRPRHGRHPAADARGGQGQGDGPVPDGPDDGRRRGRKIGPRCARSARRRLRRCRRRHCRRDRRHAARCCAGEQGNGQRCIRDRAGAGPAVRAPHVADPRRDARTRPRA